MISGFKKYIVFLLILLMNGIAPAFAQDAGEVLRVSIGYNNFKRAAANLSPEKRAEVEKLGQMAQEATTARQYGEALKHYYQAIVLLRGLSWTPEAALSSALTFKAERVVIEPGDLLRLQVGQIFSLDEKISGKVNGVIELLGLGEDKALKTIKTMESLESDFFAQPTVIEVAIPEVQPGKYRLGLKLRPATSAAPITKTVTIHIEGGLRDSLGGLKRRLALMESRLQTSDKYWIQTVWSSARYQTGLIDLADTGKINFDRINFKNELKEAEILLEALEAGRDPLASRRGDFRKAYLSKWDQTLQPYRLFIPSSYDGTKPFPLIIALHGMGGDENSYFEEYGSGAFKIEAEKRGYIVACPKGRQPASMYLGPAEKDVLDVIEEMKQAYRINPDRIYLTGHSMGGFGTWSIAMNHPQVFAALAPVAGGGNPDGMNRIAHIPQLVIHGRQDKIVPVDRSRIMVEAAKKLDVELKVIEIPGGDHDSVALQTFPQVFDFFDAHHRRSPREKALTPGEKLK